MSRVLPDRVERGLGVWTGTQNRVGPDNRVAWLRRVPLFVAPLPWDVETGLPWDVETGRFWADWRANWRDLEGVEVYSFGWSVYFIIVSPDRSPLAHPLLWLGAWLNTWSHVALEKAERMREGVQAWRDHRV